MATVVDVMKAYVKANHAYTNMNPITIKKAFLAKAGYIKANELCKTLQGSIWLAKHQSTQQGVAIKISTRDLVNRSTTVYKGREVIIQENIRSEAYMLKLVTSNPKCPKSITKFVDFFKRYVTIKKH